MIRNTTKFKVNTDGTSSFSLERGELYLFKMLPCAYQGRSHDSLSVRSSSSAVAIILRSFSSVTLVLFEGVCTGLFQLRFYLGWWVLLASPQLMDRIHDTDFLKNRWLTAGKIMFLLRKRQEDAFTGARGTDITAHMGENTLAKNW